jgi:60S ribosome subunit biogenesis protein NIP7
MRPLTEDETRMVFEKLHKFIGKNIKSLIDRPDEPYCLRLQKSKVFYVREDLMRRATNVSAMEIEYTDSDGWTQCARTGA